MSRSGSPNRDHDGGAKKGDTAQASGSDGDDDRDTTNAARRVGPLGNDDDAKQQPKAAIMRNEKGETKFEMRNLPPKLQLGELQHVLMQRGVRPIIFIRIFPGDTPNTADASLSVVGEAAEEAMMKLDGTSDLFSDRTRNVKVENVASFSFGRPVNAPAAFANPVANFVPGHVMKATGCHFCGEPGHIKSSCPKKHKSSDDDVKCHGCGKFGHYRVDCPEENNNSSSKAPQLPPGVMWGGPPSSSSSSVHHSAAATAAAATTGRRAELFPSRPGDVRDQHGEPICNECKQPGHMYKNCPLLTCRECGQRGHLYRDCPQLKCRECGQSGHLLRFCPKKNTCRNCNRPGHLSTECPDMRCHVCGGRGHMAVECPSSSRGVGGRLPPPPSSSSSSRAPPQPASSFSRRHDRGPEDDLQFIRDFRRRDAAAAGAGGYSGGGGARSRSPPRRRGGDDRRDDRPHHRSRRHSVSRSPERW